MIQNLPGVARSPFGLGLLVIRGSSPQDSGAFVEGHQIPILYHFLGGPSVLTPRLIDRVDFFPGNFGVQYGRFSGGIIDVGVKSDPTPRLHGTVDINFLDSSAYVEGPLGKGWTGAVSARRSYIDVLLPLVVPSNTTTVAPVYYDYQAGAHRELAGGRLALFAFGSDDTLKVISTDPQTGNVSLNAETGFHRIFAIWTRNLHGWLNKLSPAVGYDWLVFSAGPTTINRSAYIAELRDDLTHVFSPRLTWRVGFDGQLGRDKAFYNLPISPEDGYTRLYGQTVPRFQAGTFPLDRAGAALFTDATWDVGGGVRVIPGLRVDGFRYVSQNRLTFDPRLIVRWKTSPAQTWKAGAGIFHQMPEPQLLNPQYGNPNLPPILAAQYSAGFERLLTQKLTLDATAYLVYRYDEPVPVAGLPPFSPTGEQRSYGLEVILKHAFTDRFYGWLAYTLSRSEESASAVGAPMHRRPEQPAGSERRQAGLDADRLRSNPQPDPGGELPPARLALRDAFPRRHRVAHHLAGRGLLRCGPRPVRLPAGAHERRARAHVQPARRAHRAHLDVQRLGVQRLPRRAERLQRAKPRGDDPRLPLPGFGAHSRHPHPARARHPRTVLEEMTVRSPLSNLLLLAAASAGAAACTNLDDITTIKDLRVLAVRADPAGFLVNLADPGLAAPDTLQATLTALLVDPKGNGAEVSVSAVGCPDYLDVITSATGQAAKLCPDPGAPTGIPEPYGSALATVAIEAAGTAAPDPTVSIAYEPALPPYGLSPAQVALFFSPVSSGIAAIDDAVLLNRDFGTDVIVNLNFTLGAEQASAIKRIVYWPDLTPILPAAMQPEIPNQNPIIDHIEFFAARDATTGEPDPVTMWPLGETPTVSIAAKDRLFVRPAPPTGSWDDQAETYPLRVRSAQTMQVETQTYTELLTFQFFTTAGTFSPADRQNALEPFQMPGAIIHLDSELNLPKVADLPPDGRADIWIVVHDERAGSNWLHGNVIITP